MTEQRVDKIQATVWPVRFQKLQKWDCNFRRWMLKSGSIIVAIVVTITKREMFRYKNWYDSLIGLGNNRFGITVVIG